MHKIPIELLISFLSVACINIFCWYLQDYINYKSVSLLLIFNITLLSLYLKPKVTLFLAVLSAFSWNYFFIPPLFTFHISTLEDFLMFVAYFIIAVITGILNSKIRENESLALKQEQNTKLLYEHNKKLSKINSEEEIVIESKNGLKNDFNIDSEIYLLNDEGKIINNDKKSTAVMNWVSANFENAGKSTNVLQNSIDHMYIPLYTKIMNLGVLEIKNNFSEKDNKIFNAYIYQISSALERERLTKRDQKSKLLFESERLYSTVFNSISHELKIPIATLNGASENLKDEYILETPEIRDELINEISQASNRLDKLVSNLLDISRIESGFIKANIDWYDIYDLMNSVLSLLGNEINHENINIRLENIEIAKFDFGLLEQIIFNIINNSFIYNGDNVIVDIIFSKINDNLNIVIKDNGSGIPEDKIKYIFDKFYRVNSLKAGGSGLGLSIVKGFIDAQKGSIEVKNIYNENKLVGLKFIINIPQ